MIESTTVHTWRWRRKTRSYHRFKISFPLYNKLFTLNGGGMGKCAWKLQFLQFVSYAIFCSNLLPHATCILLLMMPQRQRRENLLLNYSFMTAIKSVISTVSIRLKISPTLWEVVSWTSRWKFHYLVIFFQNNQIYPSNQHFLKMHIGNFERSNEWFKKKV